MRCGEGSFKPLSTGAQNIFRVAPSTAPIDMTCLHFTGDKYKGRIIAAVKKLIVTGQIIAVLKTITCKKYIKCADSILFILQLAMKVTCGTNSPQPKQGSPTSTT